MISFDLEFYRGKPLLGDEAATRVKVRNQAGKSVCSMRVVVDPVTTAFASVLKKLRDTQILPPNATVQIVGMIGEIERELSINEHNLAIAMLPFDVADRTWKVYYTNVVPFVRFLP